MASRTARDINVLTKATQSHINDVINGMNFMAEQIRERGPNHDHTKLEHMEEYQRALLQDNFHQTSWPMFHATHERHHLKVKAPRDITLIDVIEYVVDSTVSAIVRGHGHIYDLSLPPHIVNAAINNTAQFIKSNIHIKESMTLGNLGAPITEEQKLPITIVPEDSYTTYKENYGELDEILKE